MDSVRFTCLWGLIFIALEISLGVSMDYHISAGLWIRNAILSCIVVIIYKGITDEYKG